MKNKIQIVFTGAQGTGKTTLTNILSEKFNINSFSVSRDMAVDSGWTAESKGSVEYQKELFNKLLKKISSKKSFISDRALSCVAGYTFKHALANMEDNNFKSLADNQYTKFCKFHNEHPDVLIVYTPIEFDIIDDGLRSTNKELQQGLDFIIKNILDVSKADYLTVTGTVEERTEQIMQELKKRALI